jgi:16S rRNA (cytidine1402-2'-O)-methyltransferase
LWVVATPIGNLEDLAPRARQALSDAQAILCEDTRRTSHLLSALGIHKRLERFDAHTTPERVEELVVRLQAGESLALVSDAGTPAVSDPGARLVARAREMGVVVTPLPGPSAVLTLLSVAGFNETAFVFRGFFPRKASEREAEFKNVEAGTMLGLSRVFVWFESPERISEALAQVAEKLPRARVVAAKELTKLHERFFVGCAADAAKAVEIELSVEGTRGEWCFALELPEPDPAAARDSSDWVKALQCLLNVQVPLSGAAREVSQQFGVARNRVYEKGLALSGKKMEEGD